ncbi:hypothetical protein L7F22_027138 [Adiantum nelumboides]|nr:hypothetical protein [Adiantum nelumboides]
MLAPLASGFLFVGEMQSMFKLAEGLLLVEEAIEDCTSLAVVLNYAPQDAHQEFYGQRATKGGLLIIEGVSVSQEGIGFPYSSGIWTEEQVQAWLYAVHDKGGYIFSQLWHVGRASDTYYQPKEDSKGILYGPISSTAKRVPDPWQIRQLDAIMAEYSQSRTFHTHEIPKVVEHYSYQNLEKFVLGFDGVEIHGAHGYLIDQFLKDEINIERMSMAAHYKSGAVLR